MDIQYNNTVVTELTTGAMFLEPNNVLENPIGFKKYVAHDNENIHMIANRFYGDTTMWYPIAKFSSLVDPIEIAQGTTLLLPIYEDKSPQDLFV